MNVFVTFRSTREVVKAERICREHGITCKVIPVPREISSECGMALQIEQQDKEIVSEVLKNLCYKISFLPY